MPAGLHVPQRTGRVATQARAAGGRTTAMANGRGLPGGRGRGLATPPPPPWGGAGAGAGSAGLAGAGAARWSWQEVGATAPGRDTMRPVGGDRRCPEKRPGLLLTANGRVGLRAQTRSRVLSSGRELALSTLHGTLRVQKETPEPEPYSAAPTVAPGGRGVRSGRRGPPRTCETPRVTEATPSAHGPGGLPLVKRHDRGAQVAPAPHMQAARRPRPPRALRPPHEQAQPSTVPGRRGLAQAHAGGQQRGCPAWSAPETPVTAPRTHQGAPEPLPPCPAPKALDGGFLAGTARWPSHSE